MGTSLKMEIQDGRHVLIKIVCISGTIGPIHVISTSNYTISMASFHLDPFLTPQNQYVITQIQDGSHFLACSLLNVKIKRIKVHEREK